MMEEGEIKFVWKIQNFSKLQLLPPLCSKVFSLGDYKWQIEVSYREDHLSLYHSVDYLSIFLQVPDSLTLPSGWSQNAKFSLTVVNQIDNKSSIRLDTQTVCKFHAQGKGWGSHSLISLEELQDPGKGYLVEDTCIIEADVTIFKDESHGSSKETNNDEIAIGSKVVTENSTEEDINAFFVDLDALISSTQNLSPKDELKEALTRINNALNMDPADLTDAGRIYEIKNAFDVLSSLDTYSVLTAEQKELLTMKEKIINLPEKAARASKDKNLFGHKEFVKMTLHRKLGRCLIDFKKTKEETEQQSRNIATLEEKVDSLIVEIGEAQKKKDSLSTKQKEMFKLSKDLRAELDALEKQWPEYEAMMKAAEEEEKMVRTEWHKMKQYVSSLHKTLYPSGFKQYYM